MKIKKTLNNSGIKKISLIFIIFLIINQLALNYLDKTADKYYESRKKLNKTNPKVYDVGHKILPDLYKNGYFHHIITFVILLPLFTNYKLLFEFLSYAIVILSIRMVLILVTILPKHKRCEIGNSFIIGGCYDKIFSGHFSTVFLATLLYKKYGLINLNTLVLLNFINSLGIIMSRSHYTIDLVVGFFVTLVIYQNNIKI